MFSVRYTAAKKPFGVRYGRNAESHFRTRERKGISLGIIQWCSKADRNPNARTCEDLHQQWTQHCEEESRIAAWELHKIIFNLHRTFLEKKRRSSKQRRLRELFLGQASVTKKESLLSAQAHPCT